MLGKLLVEEGERVVCVISRSKTSAQKAGRFLRCRNTSTALTAVPPDTNLILVTTPHGAIEEVAGALARAEHLDFRRLAVCHASGMLTSDALKPLQEKGATVFSFHPLQTFPRDFEPRDIVGRARGIYYGVDGSPKGLRKARQLARKLGGNVIEIQPGLRVFYHAACVVASNHLTTLLWILETMFQTLRTHEKEFYRVFKPIVMATLHNIENTSPARALSGPVARGGVETLADHLASIKTYAPGLISYFSQLSEETVKLALVKGSINDMQAAALNNCIQSYRDSHVNAKDYH